MSVSKFGFTCGGKRTKTGDNETKNKKPKYDVYKERQNDYEKRHVRSFQQPWGNEWVRHTVMNNTNGADKRIMYCEMCQFFSGHWIWDHQNVEASVPKRHQNMNISVGPWLDN